MIGRQAAHDTGRVGAVKGGPGAAHEGSKVLGLGLGGGRGQVQGAAVELAVAQQPVRHLDFQGFPPPFRRTGGAQVPALLLLAHAGGLPSRPGGGDLDLAPENRGNQFPDVAGGTLTDSCLGSTTSTR